MSIQVRPARDRFVTYAAGRTTYHSFSFGTHYDPHNVTFGALVAFNDEQLPRGTGYAEHPHRNLEIVTVVLSGRLRHHDSQGQRHVLEPGDAQVLSAGSGVRHEEGAADGHVRFLQTWLRPDESDLEPMSVRESIEPGRLQLVASGDPGPQAPLPVRARGASLHVGRLAAGERLVLPDAPRLHVFVADGAVLAGERELSDGDAARLIDEGSRPLTAVEAATLLVWALP